MLWLCVVHRVCVPFHRFPRLFDRPFTRRPFDLASAPPASSESWRFTRPDARWEGRSSLLCSSIPSFLRRDAVLRTHPTLVRTCRCGLVTLRYSEGSLVACATDVRFFAALRMTRRARRICFNTPSLHRPEEAVCRAQPNGSCRRFRSPPHPREAEGHGEARGAGEAGKEADGEEEPGKVKWSLWTTNARDHARQTRFGQRGGRRLSFCSYSSSSSGPRSRTIMLLP
jgi:hypothetical protein